MLFSAIFSQFKPNFVVILVIQRRFWPYSSKKGVQKCCFRLFLASSGLILVVITLVTL